ncbi:MAG: hypothetical protein VKJ44_06535 [Synechococcus sp.]|nr:hypothetical protein [Synechococcus sp.]
MKGYQERIAAPPLRWQEGLAGLLALAIGLHLPRSFALLYPLSALLLGCSWRDGGMRLLIWLRPWWPLPLATLLYSLSYGVGMLQGQLWRWPADRAELLACLLLPTLLLLAGLATAEGWGRRGWRLPLLILTSYALGSLLFALLALAVSRQPWWNLQQSFAPELQIPWGSADPVNVRSVEQNAIAAVLSLPACLIALRRGWTERRRWLLLLACLPALLGLHAIFALQGRLGLLLLLLAALPPLAAALRAWRGGGRLGGRRLGLGLALLAAALAAWPLQRLRGAGAAIGWAQGLCDERFSLHLAILAQAWKAPWGGRQLQVPYQLCDGTPALLAPQNGTVTLAHNVILDVFLDAGLVPAILLTLLLLPLLLLALHAFLRCWRARAWSWRIAWLWGWFVLLLGQWLFQPLLYADGLLFYLSFFVFALLAAGLRQLPRPAGTGELAAVQAVPAGRQGEAGTAVRIGQAPAAPPAATGSAAAPPPAAARSPLDPPAE